MSSVSSSFAQTPRSGKYLFAPAESAYGGFSVASLTAAVASNASIVKSFDGSMLNSTNAVSFISSIGAPTHIYAGDLFLDMGKQLHVMENGVLVAIFRLAQKMMDPSSYTEGINADSIYICTYQSSGSNCTSPFAMVKVVRSA